MNVALGVSVVTALYGQRPVDYGSAVSMQVYRTLEDVSLQAPVSLFRHGLCDAVLVQLGHGGFQNNCFLAHGKPPKTLWHGGVGHWLAERAREESHFTLLSLSEICALPWPGERRPDTHALW